MRARLDAAPHARPVNPQRTTFVFAGGGSLGAVEVGMLQALTEHGLKPDFVVGASAGAINAAYYAGDPSAEGIARLDRLWRGLTRAQVMPFRLRDLLRIAMRREFVVDPSELRRLLEHHLPYQQLEQARIPVHVIATDMVLGQEVLLSSGPVVSAVLASTAIPGVFPPVRLGERLLIDGGVANNTPISAAIALGAERVIVLPTGFACALKQVPRDAVGRAMHALSMLVSRQLAGDIERYGRQVRLQVVPPLCPVHTSPYDYSAGAELIDRAAAETRAWIRRGGLERSDGMPHQMAEHSH